MVEFCFPIEAAPVALMQVDSLKATFSNLDSELIAVMKNVRY